MYDNPGKIINIKYRRKLEGYRSDQQPSKKYSHDYNDPYIEKSSNSSRVTNLRKCESIEWRVEDTQDCHEDSLSSNMVTLDRRISKSSDQLNREDIFKQGKIVPVSETVPGNEFKYRSGNQDSMPDYFSGCRIKNGLKPQVKPIQRSKRTPFEMFLEDDGPYSRKLYGPIKSDKSVTSYKDRKIEKVVMKNVITRRPEPGFVDSSNLSSTFDGMSIKKGLLWQQRDSLFSRWRDRFFILTLDYLNCFKKGSSNSSSITEMGEYIFKVKLSDIRTVSLLDKRGFLTICLVMNSLREGRIYLRRSEAIRDWYNVLKSCVEECKKKRESWHQDSGWTQALSKTNMSSGAIDAILRDEEHSEHNSDDEDEIQIQMKHKAINRLSLVSDLLMNEAIANYARAKVEKSEDSGVESGHSLDNTGSESNSEHSSHEEFTEHKVTVQIINQDTDLQVSNL